MTKNFFDNVKTALNFTELNYMFFDKRKRSTIYTLLELPIFDKTKSPRYELWQGFFSPASGQTFRYSIFGARAD